MRLASASLIARIAMWMRHRYLPAALLAAGVCIATPACAAQTYGYRQYNREIERRAYDNGVHDGRQAADKDIRKHRSFSMERHDEWRDADDGYHRDFGDRDVYRRVFRDGFRAGYSEVFNRSAAGYPGRAPVIVPPAVIYPGRAPGAVYGSRAAEVGYRDGLEVGRNDARDRESYDPIRSSRYRSADHDYDNRYGSRDDYKRDYRAAFQRGYDEGYRGVRR
jgi:hypothetical protein